VLLLVISFESYSQKDTNIKSYKNIIGLDAAYLFNQYIYGIYDRYINFYSNSNYVLSYRRMYKSQALRMALGGAHNDNNQKTNDTQSSKYVYNTFNAGLGYEKHFQLTKRWYAYYGLEFILRYNKNESEYIYSTSYTNKSYIQDIGYGLSPLFGVGCKLNNRISISTESSYNITYTQSDYKYSYSNSPANNRTTTSTGFNATFFAPTSISLWIYF
jgi:hypothetical protein